MPQCCYGACACPGFERFLHGEAWECVCGHHELLHAPPPPPRPRASSTNAKRWLYVRPKQGLCNRLRVAAAALLLADDLDGDGRGRGALARAFASAGTGDDDDAAAAPLCLRIDAYAEAAAAHARARRENARWRVALDWETHEPAFRGRAEASSKFVPMVVRRASRGGRRQRADSAQTTAPRRV